MGKERIVRDWTKLIIPRVNFNTKPNGKLGDKSFCTTDKISIRSDVEIESKMAQEKKRSATDFALMSGSYQSMGNYTQNHKRTTNYWLRSCYGYTDGDVEFITDRGEIDCYICSVGYGLCPSLDLSIPTDTNNNSIQELGDIKEVKTISGKTLYHTIELGEYPKTRVNSELQKKLESLYNGGHLKDGLECTGRLFTTNGQNYQGQNFIFKQNPEFEFNGDKYIRGKVRDGHSDRLYEDGIAVPELDSIEWVKVEPITFRISNYLDFENGSADHLELDSDEVILDGIPFYPDHSHNRSGMWQNSLVRAFLNSANSAELDGNPAYGAVSSWDFRNSGFMHQAFNMTRQPTREYIIPEAEKEICDNAFEGCVGIERFIIPPTVTKIGDLAFEGCVNSQIVIELPRRNISLSEDSFCGTDVKYLYVSKNNDNIILSPYKDKGLSNGYFEKNYNLDEVKKFVNTNYRENFIQLDNWKREGVIKFIPPEYTLTTFPSSEMGKYFVNKNNQRWGKLVKTLGFDTLDGDEKNNSLVDLMKIYYAIGGFSENQGESEKAYQYTLEYIAMVNDLDQTPSDIGQEIHRRFSKINLKGAYNPTFAKFFMKYYHKDPDFMNFRLKDSRGNLMVSQDYLCNAHNSFDRILKAFPNRVVNGNEERALLTPKFVAEHSCAIEYDFVDKGNELLADTIGRYGYTEEQFYHIQDIYNKAKTIKDNFVIQADKSKGKNGITFRVLDKDDPLGFVIGDITNCCQHIGGAGESCVDDGYINPNAGFLVFEDTILDEDGNPTDETRILGQAYIWYDPKTKTVCYDNIEMPSKVLDELRQGTKHEDKLSSKDLLDAVVESADAIMLAMNRNGIKVDRVTTGQGYNDLKTELDNRFGKPEINPKAKHRNYGGYSDAKDAQYIIRTYDEITNMYADQIKETLNEIRLDLRDIQQSENFNGYEL